MRIEAVDPRDLDLDVADDISALVRSAQSDVGVSVKSGPALLLGVREGSGEDEDQTLLLARDDEGVLSGWTHAVEPRREYTDMVFVQGCVAPDRRRDGLGRALLDQVLASTTRTRVRARTWEGTDGPAVLDAWGFTRSHTSAVRRLPMDDLDPAWASMRLEAEAAAADYELVRRAGPTPEADLPEMVVLREAINDAPDAHEFESYPVERITAYEQALVRRRQTQYTVVARHRATGEPAALTMVCVDEFDPSVAHQEDTSVVRAHRGHRLGLLLKLDMIAWLREERPEVTASETWNDATNHHMIAVNERLGMREVARSAVYKRDV